MKKFKLTIAFLSILSIVNGQDENAFRITHGPYLCDMSETGVTIVWMTNNNALSWVEIAPDDGSHFYAEERPKYFQTHLGRKQASSHLHSIRIDNLKPGTRYRYAVFSREILDWKYDSRIIYGITTANSSYSGRSLNFKTFSSEDDTVSFIMYNDIHGRAEFMKDLSKNADLKFLDMVIMNGDMSTSINSEEQLFTDFIDASVDLFAKTVPIVFNRGNHETRGTWADKLMDYFPVRGGQVYRTFNVGDVAFIILDCGEDKPDSSIEYSGLADFDAYRLEQAKWLKEAINAESIKNAAKKVVIIHMPPYVSNWHGTLHINETLVPLLNEAGIDVVLSGHTHRYSYNAPVAGKTTFPVIVNSNNAYLRGDIINGIIRIRLIGPEGTKPIEHTLE
ncbi:MAG TPA: metallophosphoesterase [Candidatus Cloacimonadota bacterium]|nr:metallophosphoesterase [Candidatus Cloacimonadota bacterium]